MLDSDIDKKLRDIQSKMIQYTSKVSFSEIINETLRKDIKK